MNRLALGLALAPTLGMEDAPLRALAEAFYDKAWAEHRTLPSLRDDREFWTNQYFVFARAVRDADARTVVLRQIHALASQHYDRLNPHDKLLGLGQVLRSIADDAARATK